MIRTRRPRAEAGRGGRKGRPARSGTPSDTRRDLLLAAATEFAVRGYEGARVERIAKTASVNKAMLYYHFRSKHGLYQEVIRDMASALGARARAIAATPAPAQARLDAWVEAVVQEASARPWFPPVMLHELASGAPHLDATTFGLMNDVLKTVTGIISDGQARGEFRKTDPLLTYLTFMPTVLIFFARERIRARTRVASPLTSPRTSRQLVTHLRAAVRGMLQKEA